MDIKDLVLLLEAGSPFEARVGFAVGLAERFGAALTTLFSSEPPAVEIPDGFAIGPVATADVLKRRDAALTAALAPARTALAAALAGRPITHREIEAPAGEAPQALALGARYHDLVILRRPAPHDAASHALAEHVILDSGAACLVIPDEAKPCDRFEQVVVGWNGSREAKRALQDALPLLVGAKSVRLLVIDGETREPTSGAAREEVLCYLRRHGVDATLERIEALGGDAGSALLRACTALKADLLVMGAYGHSRTRELVLGGATRTALAHAALPVLMSH